MISDLYNGEILTLASTLRNERLEDPGGTARKVSKLCGSWLEIDLNVKDRLVSECALRVQACALGQSSAAILKENIIGANIEELKLARNALLSMLKNKGDPPIGRFRQLSALESVREYPARHMSTMLAFEAAVEAMESALEAA